MLTVQSTLGKAIFLAPWDREQEATFPPLQSPDDVPTSRESIGIYLGTYINPKEDGSRIYMNLRLITHTTPPVPLDRFGMELADALPKFKMQMNKQPQACQAVKSCCIGWFMYSSKQINSPSFVTETKLALGIPSNVALGISYRTIVNEFGKRPIFNRDDPPAASIHLDIDERFYMVYQPKASSLWQKNSRKRLPNGVQLRLVPCFTSPIGKSMTDDIRADAKTLAERQYYFVKEHIRTIEYHFISLLDTPISQDDSMTLRRAMMARAPKNKPLSRLIHNVDQSWNQMNKYVVTTVVGREEEANRFLSNLIPEMLHTYGSECGKWFSAQGLMVYKDVRWNPLKGTTSSTNAKVSAAMVNEDLWDLSDKWKTISETPDPDQRPDTMQLDPSKQKPTTDTGQKATTKTSPAPAAQMLTRLEGDKSVASFGATFGRTIDSDDEKEASIAAAAAASIPDLTGTQFVFSPEQVARDHDKALLGSESDGKSMSTAGKTTDSIRLKFKEAQEEIAELKLALVEKTAKEQHKLDLIAHSAKMKECNTPSLTLSDEHMLQTAWGPSKSVAGDATDALAEAMDTDAQLLGAALADPPKETITPDPDAMEEEQHAPVHVGASVALPDSITSGSSSALSSQTSVSHDTAELVKKLTSQQITSSKSSVKNGSTSDSHQDSASSRSSVNDSESLKDHPPEDSYGNASTAFDGAGLRG